MDYLEGGNDSHLVVGSGAVKMESGSNTGLIAVITQISKALHRRTTEELLGMRLKQFFLLGYVRDHGNGGASQQELETASRSTPTAMCCCSTTWRHPHYR